MIKDAIKKLVKGFDLTAIETEKVFEREEKVRWVCRKCGHVHEGTKALKNCPVCGHPEAYFEIEKTNY